MAHEAKVLTVSDGVVAGTREDRGGPAVAPVLGFVALRAPADPERTTCMNQKYRRLKGTRDIMLEEIERWRWCEERWIETLARYGYGEIRTPIIEPVDLFLRSNGEGTDVVDKEMYAFETKGGENLVLRPEMTASVVRAYLENGLIRQPGTVKFFYMGPMFRHDRPQAGRYRQFWQFDVEAIGELDPESLDGIVRHLELEPALRARGPQCDPVSLPG